MTVSLGMAGTGRAATASAADSFDHQVLEVLCERGKLDTAGLDRIHRLGSETGEKVFAVLVKLGLVSEIDLAQCLADLLGLPLIHREDYPLEAVLNGRLSPNFLKSAVVIPVAESATEIELAMADPTDDFAAQSVAVATGKPVNRRVATASDVEHAIERLYGTGASAIGRIVQGVDGGEGEAAHEDSERLKDLASEAPVIRLVNLLIGRAVEARASDIHIEPFENRLRVRYRIDGVLQEVESPPARLKAAIVSRVKILAKLNIAERRLPQDGRIRMAFRGTEVDFRVSSVPTIHGESVVLRVLDKTSATFDFAALGLEADTLAAYRRALEHPNGIVLVTGPTGSGKTTTLYTSLLHLNAPGKKILTVEDPVEYQLEGVNQIQVKPQIGLSFAHVLRSILRQDPDIVMIGEIRDLETARIAAQAALTGHLVLSTLHTNSAAASITRLVDMGLEPYLLASTVAGVTAQRLVRILCPQCARPHPAQSTIVRELQLHRFADDRPAVVLKAVGCGSCAGTGYRGRTAIAEVLTVTERVRRLILERGDAQTLHSCAVSEGMRSLLDEGMRKVARGMTTVEEVLRVTGDA